MHTEKHGTLCREEKPEQEMDRYNIIKPSGRGAFALRISELHLLLADYLDEEQAEKDVRELLKQFGEMGLLEGEPLIA